MLNVLLSVSWMLPVATDAPACEEAMRLYDAGRAVEAIETLLSGMETAVAGGGYQGPLAAAEAEMDALVLAWLVRETESWSETIERLAPLASALAPVSPQARFWVECSRGEALRCVGRLDEARALATELGYFNDFLLAGPFDNERGGGFDVAHEPERGVDPAQVMQGKEREVRWRPNPCREHPLLRVSLEELYVPAQQALAYAATAIQAERDRDVELRIGTSGPFKVFLDGRELAARRVERPHFMDQDRIVLPLRAGWNQLVIKLAVETGPWTLEARLTELSGEPARGLVVDAAHCGPAEGAPRASDARGAALARELLASAGDDASAARMLALHELIVHPDDRTQESDAAAARRAVEIAPDDPLALHLLARALRPEVASRAEMALAPYVSALQAVLRADPAHVSALLELAEVATELAPMPDRAEDATRRALEAAPESWRAAVGRARYLYGRNRDTEARATLERAAAFPEGRRRSDAMVLRAELLLDRGDDAASLAELERGVAQRLSAIDLVQPLVARLVDAGRADDAAELAARGLEAAPFSIDGRLRMARAFEYAGREDVARALVERAREIAPEHPLVLEQLARLEERAGRLEEASALLAAVLQLEPGNDRVHRKRLVLMREAGAAERFEAPWRRDPAELAHLPMPEGGANDPVEALDRTTVWRLHPDGSESRYEHAVLRVLSSAGVQALDRYAIAYPPDARLNVLFVRVLRRDGTSERAPAPRQGDLERGGVLYRVFDLPPVAPGDVVDVEYRVDQTEPDVFGRYFGERHVFHPDVVDPLAPTRRSELVVIAPPGIEIFASERHGDRLERERTSDEHGNTIFRWVAHDLERPPMESVMPRREELVPLVDVTTYRSWEELGRWWWSFISTEFDTSPAMEAKVDELTRGLESEGEKVAAIARFVGQEIRYNTWPFGTHGYEPFRASTIFERRFGDCKDKSILLRQMLARIGVEAVPVLLRAEFVRAAEPLDAAMVEHFNHCIAYVTPTDERPGYYLDATADRNPIEYLRADDQGARVLHVTPEGAEVHEIPYAPAAENAARRAWEVALGPDGSARVTLADDSNGHFGVVMRYVYGGQREAIADELARELGEAFGQVEFDHIDTSDLDDIRVPAHLEARFRCASVGAPQSGGRHLPLAFDPLRLDGVAVERPEERVHDVVLDRPYAVRSTVRWRLDAGLRLARLPEPSTVEVPGLLRYHARATTEPDGAILVQRDFELLRRRIPVAEYATLHDALEEIRLAEQRTVFVEIVKEEGR